MPIFPKMNVIFKLFLIVFLSLTVFHIAGIADGYLAPLKQFDAGTMPRNVVCNEPLVLIFKLTDQSPKCVKADTAIILGNRGFSIEYFYSNDMSSEFKNFQNQILDDKCTKEDFPINWSYCNLYGRVLTNIDLRYANLEHANLFGVTLNKKNLTGANLSYSSLKKGNLDGSDFTNANFSYANLIDTKVRNAVLTNAYMKNANLWKTDFTGSNLTNADLRNSTLSHAILSFVDLKNTNIDGAGTWGTNLNHCFNHKICE